MKEKSEFLSVKEIASNLRCSKAHVYNAINGKLRGVTPLPAICMGRRRLVLRSSLEMWKRLNEQGVSALEALSICQPGVSPN